MQINPGDIVRLRSGGPLMTVRHAVDTAASNATGLEAGVHCDWIDEQGRPHNAVYSQDQLEFNEP
jgi:uncharacterized protein YodC (DUF2158 family)